ncbi:unnamed protein product [Adineta steineri]|nr:unnamed protein product [Adineta steineri]
MVRIAEGEHPKDIKEKNYFNENKEYRVDKSGSPILFNCLMYKLCYYRFGELYTDSAQPSGFDRTRSVEIGHKNFDLEHVEEAYTSANWIVRIYRVKKLSNRFQAKDALEKSTSSLSEESFEKNHRKGVILNKPHVKRGTKKSIR